MFDGWKKAFDRMFLWNMINEDSSKTQKKEKVQNPSQSYVYNDSLRDNTVRETESPNQFVEKKTGDTRVTNGYLKALA